MLYVYNFQNLITYHAPYSAKAEGSSIVDESGEG